MSYVPCCVPGCKDRRSSRHRFPVPRTEMSRFKKWIKLIQNEKLYSMDPKRVYNNFRVCSLHFTEDHVSLFGVPTKLLPPRKDDDSERSDESDESDKEASSEKELKNKERKTERTKEGKNNCDNLLRSTTSSLGVNSNCKTFKKVYNNAPEQRITLNDMYVQERCDISDV